MAIKEQIVEQAPQGEALTDAEEKDLIIAVSLAQNLIDDGGIDVIKSAETSKDQGQVIGQFLLQMGEQIAEKLSGMVDISPRIMLAEGGWVEQISDYLQEEYQIPKVIMDRAEMYVGGMAQNMSLTEQEKAQQGGGAEAPVPAAPPAPMLPQPGVV